MTKNDLYLGDYKCNDIEQLLISRFSVQVRGGSPPIS